MQSDGPDQRALQVADGASGHFENVHQQFPRSSGDPLVAITSISFGLDAGSLVTLLGPSGCGKRPFCGLSPD